jgi:hypothetical protein
MGLPAVREWYEFVEASEVSGPAIRLGPFAWIAVRVLFVWYVCAFACAHARVRVCVLLCVFCVCVYVCVLCVYMNYYNHVPCGCSARLYDITGLFPC